MLSIRSKKHFWNFYAVIGFAVLFFGGIGVFSGYVFLKMKSTEDFRNSYYVLLLISISFVYLAFYTIKTYLKNSPTITLDLSSITIGKETFLLHDIEEIMLKGKMPFKYFIEFPVEGLRITFKNGYVRYLFDDIYGNSSEIKSFLDQVVVKKKKYAAPIIDKIDLADIRLSEKEKFKGNPIFSFRGIVLWGFLGFLALLVFSKTEDTPSAFLKFVYIFSPFWLILNGWFMHYFECTQNYFIVKNHLWIWKNDVYSFKNINYIVFETRGNLPNCLRITTQDFKNKFYPAGTLSDKSWLKLKNRLEEKEVEVRNYSIK